MKKISFIFVFLFFIHNGFSSDLILGELQDSDKPNIGCIVKLFGKLDLKINMKTNPAILEDVLKNDLYLDNFTSFIKLLGSKLTEEQSLRPMLSKIISAILLKRSAVKDFVCEVVKTDLIPELSEYGKEKIVRTLHLIYLLEILTNEMAINFDFSNQVREFYIEKRKEFGISDKFIESFFKIVKLTGSVFESVKTKTMDYTFNMYKRLQESGPGVISKKLYNERNRSLRLNIFEAMMTDLTGGKKDNAYAGYALIRKSPVNKTVIMPETYFIKNYFDKGWTDLYESWNLAFVLANLDNLDNLDIILPKLLIPAVIYAKDEDYLYNRAISLWVTINMNLFAAIKKRKEVLPNAQEMAKLFGKINVPYAKKFIKKYSLTQNENFQF